MSHVHRLRVADRVFFVTVNLRLALALLHAGECAERIAALGASRAKLGFKLLGDVLMPDHGHALMGTTHPLTISRAVQDVKWLSALAFNGARGNSGPVWQHQFGDRFVRHGKEYTDRLMCMHMNPVRKGWVAKPEQWRWSSYNNFSLDVDVVKACPIAIDNVMLPKTYRA